MIWSICWDVAQGGTDADLPLRELSLAGGCEMKPTFTATIAPIELNEASAVGSAGQTRKVAE
jgi:hypothetical protein